jgi:hypothetical protein
MLTRPALALLVSLAILGSVGGYLKFARYAHERNAAPGAETNARAEGTFNVEVMLSFDAGVDSAFSLDPAKSTAVRVRFRGSELLRVDQPVTAGTTLRVEDVEGIVSGANEFFIEAQPANQGFGAAHAARVRIFRNGHPIADSTLWSEPGLPVQGVVRVDVPQHIAETHAD